MGDLFTGGSSFYIKKKLKYEIFNDQKSLQTMLFSVITKNLNCEILTKNLVTFKRWDFLLTAIWPRPTLGHYQGGNLTHPMLIT